MPAKIARDVTEFRALGAASKRLNAPFDLVGVESFVEATPRVATVDAQMHEHHFVMTEVSNNKRNALAAMIRDLTGNAAS